MNSKTMRRAIGLASLALATCAAHAETDDPVASASYTEAVHLMSDCAGTWMFFAAVQRRMGDETTAEQMSELHDGASLAAQYLLQVDHAQRTGKPKAVGEFEPYVVARLDETLSRLSTHFKREEFDALETEMNTCVEALSAQESILEALRDSMGSKP